MLIALNLGGEIAIALRELRPEDRELIDLVLAEKAFALVLEKSTRTVNPVRDKGEAVRNALSERHIGAGRGWHTTRQKKYGAYFRLLIRLLKNREHRMCRRKRREVV